MFTMKITVDFYVDEEKIKNKLDLIHRAYREVLDYDEPDEIILKNLILLGSAVEIEKKLQTQAQIAINTLHNACIINSDVADSLRKMI